MTDRQRRWYEDKLAAFTASHGKRYELVTGMTYAAAKCGLTHEDVIADCRARMPDFRAEHAANIRRGMESAYKKIKSQPFTGEYRRTAEPPPDFPDKVKELILAGGIRAHLDDLHHLGGVPLAGMMEQEQTIRFLQTLYEPADLLHIETSQRHEVARLGVHLRTRDDWIMMAKLCLLSGDLIGRNPYTGETGETGEGKPSLTASSCVAAFRYALIEFDALPLEEQAAFWLGFFRKMPKLAPSIVSLTYSGGKSIHGLLRVKADKLTAPKVAQSLRRLFSSNPEKDTRREKDGREIEVYPFRADPMGFVMRGGTRLAGARRMGCGELQRLLYLKA